MSDHVQKVVEEFQQKLLDHETKARDLKRIINTLLVHAGQAALYPDEELELATRSAAIRPDQFYGQPLAKVIREILLMRKASGNGPAQVAEIYKAMIQGGYRFDTADEDNAKRGLRISLSKNSIVFHRLPNGMWGLLEWYPNAKEPKKPKIESPAAEPVDETELRSEQTEEPPEEVSEGPEEVVDEFTESEQEFVEEPEPMAPGLRMPPPRRAVRNPDGTPRK